MISTVALKASTQGHGMALKFEPASGTVLLEFKITGASCSINGIVVKCTGSSEGVPNGANIVFGHAEVTTQGALKCNAKAAGTDGTLTLESRANSSQAYTPLSFTT
jgi:hypothetical protein